MNVVKHFISLNMHEDTVRQIVNVRVRDSAQRFIITLNECSTKYVFSDDMFAQLVWEAPEGATANDIKATIINDAIVADIPRGALLVPGQYQYQVRLYDTVETEEGERAVQLIASPGFWLNVIDRVANIEEEAGPPDPELDDWDTAYEKIVAEHNEKIGEVEAAISAAVLWTTNAENAANAANVAAVAALEIVNGLVAITNAEIDDICDEEDGT